MLLYNVSALKMDGSFISTQVSGGSIMKVYDVINRWVREDKENDWNLLNNTCPVAIYETKSKKNMFMTIGAVLGLPNVVYLGRKG